jgi:hypothetical protein
MRIYRPFGEFLDHVGMRLTGPMSFRFILQPLVATLLGIRDGLNDARAGRPPYLWDLIVRPEGRRRQIEQAVESLAKPIIVAIIVDAMGLQFTVTLLFPKK